MHTGSWTVCRRIKLRPNRHRSFVVPNELHTFRLCALRQKSWHLWMSAGEPALIKPSAALICNSCSVSSAQDLEMNTERENCTQIRAAATPRSRVRFVGNLPTKKGFLVVRLSFYDCSTRETYVDVAKPRTTTTKVAGRLSSERRDRDYITGCCGGCDGAGSVLFQFGGCGGKGGITRWVSGGLTLKHRWILFELTARGNIKYNYTLHIFRAK